MAHLNSASFPTIMLSGRMLISYLCVVTEIKNLHFVFYIDRDEKLSYSLTLLYPVHIKIPKVTKTQWRGSQIICFRINPWINTDKVGHKAWYRAFKEGVVAHNNALSQDVNLVSLTWNWNISGIWLTKINIFNAVYTGQYSNNYFYPENSNQGCWPQSQSKTPQTQNQIQNLELSIWKLHHCQW